jgi:hypothetical protein
MPCYTIRTVSVEFKVGNIDLLKKAIENVGHKITTFSDQIVEFRHFDYGRVFIDLKNQTMTTKDFNDGQMSTLSNQIKRAYSECIIDEIAKRQKWIKKKMGDNRYQLQRF